MRLVFILKELAGSRGCDYGLLPAPSTADRKRQGPQMNENKGLVVSFWGLIA